MLPCFCLVFKFFIGVSKECKSVQWFPDVSSDAPHSEPSPRPKVTGDLAQIVTHLNVAVPGCQLEENTIDLTIDHK